MPELLEVGLGIFSRHASVPEININVYKFTYVRAPRFLLMNKFIQYTTAVGHTVIVHKPATGAIYGFDILSKYVYLYWFIAD